MKPGSSVALPRSMTFAPGGTADAPTAAMRVPCTTTTPGDTSRPLRPSNRCAALSTMGDEVGVAEGACAGAAKASERATDRPVRATTARRFIPFPLADARFRRV
jgi:hypothetical protein